MELLDTGTTIRLKYLELELMEQGDRILQLEWELGWARLILGGALEKIMRLKRYLWPDHNFEADEPQSGYYKI